jgi:hypothetical protein
MASSGFLGALYPMAGAVFLSPPERYGSFAPRAGRAYVGRKAKDVTIHFKGFFEIRKTVGCTVPDHHASLFIQKPSDAIQFL